MGWHKEWYINLIILALDSSGVAAGICLLEDGKILHEECLDLGFTHSETLLPLVNKTLTNAGIGIRSIDVFALAKGPGSFTGLRIGMALVKGFALPLSKPVLAVSTLEAMALGACYSDLCEEADVIVPMLNARRQELYWAAFECKNQNIIRIHNDNAGSAKTEVTPYIEKLAQKNQKLVLLGDGAQLCYTFLSSNSNINVLPNFAHNHVAYGAALLAKKAYETNKLDNVFNMAPAYIRQPQAERERLERLQQKTSHE